MATGYTEIMFSCMISLCFFAGTEEAGKNMFIKQLKIIHGCGERDRDEFKVLVYRNVFTDIQKLIQAMEILHIPYENPANEVCMLSAPIDCSDKHFMVPFCL